MKTKFITLLCAAMLLIGCVSVPKEDAPTLTEISAPEETPRQKLWDDDVYIAIPANNNVAPKQLVYDNYGDIVAECPFTMLNYSSIYGGVGVYEKSDVVKVEVNPYVNESYYPYYIYNLFSFDTMSYVIDDTFGLKKKSYEADYVAPKRECELIGNMLEFSENGEKFTYELPTDSAHEYQIYALNDVMVWLYDYAVQQYKLLLYKTGKDISNMIGITADPQIFMREGFAIIEKANDEATEYKVIDGEGKVLYQNTVERYHETNPYDYVAPVKKETGERVREFAKYGKTYVVTYRDTAIEIKDGDLIYTVFATKDDYVEDITDELVFVRGKENQCRLIRYKEVKDISEVFRDFSGYIHVGLYEGYVKVTDSYGCALLDSEGNKLFGTGGGKQIDWFNENLVFLKSNYPDEQGNRENRLVRYKTGEDISKLLQDGMNDKSAELYGNYIYTENYNEADSAWRYSLLDDNANFCFEGEGSLLYLGHNLFCVIRGNYYGVVNAKGEWLIRRLINSEF